MLVQERHLTVNGDLKVAGDINADSDGVYITVNGNCYIDGEMGAIQLGGGSSGCVNHSRFVIRWGWRHYSSARCQFPKWQRRMCW